jgi:hypothetical protein
MILKEARAALAPNLRIHYGAESQYVSQLGHDLLFDDTFQGSLKERQQVARYIRAAVGLAGDGSALSLRGQLRRWGQVLDRRSHQLSDFCSPRDTKKRTRRLTENDQYTLSTVLACYLDDPNPPAARLADTYETVTAVLDSFLEHLGWLTSQPREEHRASYAGLSHYVVSLYAECALRVFRRAGPAERQELRDRMESLTQLLLTLRGTEPLSADEIHQEEDRKRCPMNTPLAYTLLDADLRRPFEVLAEMDHP